jgi:hypothetical protein
MSGGKRPAYVGSSRCANIGPLSFSQDRNQESRVGVTALWKTRNPMHAWSPRSVAPV